MTCWSQKERRWTCLCEQRAGSLPVGQVDAALQSAEPGLLQLLRVSLQGTTPAADIQPRISQQFTQQQEVTDDTVTVFCLSVGVSLLHGEQLEAEAAVDVLQGFDSTQSEVLKQNHGVLLQHSRHTSLYCLPLLPAADAFNTMATTPAAKTLNLDLIFYTSLYFSSQIIFIHISPPQ